MSTFTQTFENLLRDCGDKEQQLVNVMDFSNSGGEFRIRITVDHPDEAVRRVIETLAATYVPNKTILSQVLKAANKEYRKVKEDFVKTAALHPIATERGAT